MKSKPTKEEKLRATDILLTLIDNYFFENPDRDDGVIAEMRRHAIQLVARKEKLTIPPAPKSPAKNRKQQAKPAANGAAEGKIAVYDVNTDNLRRRGRGK